MTMKPEDDVRQVIKPTLFTTKRGLTRKPMVGDSIIDGNGQRLGVVVKLDGDVCRYQPHGAPAEAKYWSCFIWNFSDGLNSWISIE